MQYYRGQASTAERAKYDESLRASGEVLKKLFENTISDPEAHRIAALYYAELFTVMKAPSELESREKVKKLVLYHADWYDRLYRGDRARDARVDQARIQVGGR
ncbi:MAG: hypothetical protein HY042_00645, partial [Spirochaetia bacterium]|nr:hypothetical protein [Spirochaetia bacterium]